MYKVCPDYLASGLMEMTDVPTIAEFYWETDK